MIRRISTKWVLAVFAAVMVPFVGFAFWVNGFVRERISDDVVRYHLLGHAAELAERLDREIDERRKDVEVLAHVRDLELALEGRDDDASVFSTNVESLFDGVVVGGGAFDYVLAITATGTVRYMASRGRDGAPLAEAERAALEARPWHQELWFERALADGSALLDWQRLELGGAPPDSLPIERRYHVGCAQRVDGAEDPRVASGLVLGLLSWARFQGELESYGALRQGPEREGLVNTGIFRSTYAWIWGADADTIQAHRSRELYGQRVSGPVVALPQMAAAARASRAGMYPDYIFRGIEKRAAFQHMRAPSEGGFGWVVGVGVDFPDIDAPVRTITANLVTATVLVLLVSALITLIVARRTTRPIQELQQFTRQVALGDLDVQVPAGGHDELGELARSFNRMTRQLKENRAELLRAEKDAAWREMARQVAHEIKNPLTPLRLSADLLERAHQDRSPEFESILERTIGIVRRQCDHMREIAKDFHAFAGRHHELTKVDVGAVLDEVLALHGAWAQELGVTVVRSGSGGIVRADQDELRRAFINLVSNALEAMPDGGRFEADVATVGQRVVVELRDTGVGLPEEARGRLFDPYFTTRSSGTGLGLAIVRRIVEDLGGDVILVDRPDTRGALARLSLPRADTGARLVP